nr:reverse transcriptase domain-containing protein [Tanacetum cinerariifolium]
MHTRSSSKLFRNQTSNPTSFTNPTPKGRIRRSSKQKVENLNFEENPLPPEVPMAENHTMVQLLQAPIDGYEDAIVIPEITATNFKLKHGLINLDSLNSTAGGNFLDKMPADFMKIIESKSKVRQTQAKAVVAKVNSNSSTPAVSSDVVELKDMVRALLLDKKNQYSAQTSSPTPAPIKAVEPNCVTCGDNHAYQNCPKTSGNVYQDNIQGSANTASSSGSGILPGNTITNPKEDLKGFTTRSGVAYQGPTIPIPSKVTKQGTEVTKDQVQTSNSQSTAPVQPTVAQSESETLVSEPVVAPISAPMPNLKPLIPYPSRRDTERCRDQANEQIEKFYEIFKEMSFEISFTDALMLMPKFASTLKALIGNKEKLSEMARTPMNEHCSAVILNKLPKKLGDPSKFLIPCEFLAMDKCLALADLGASINLMPLSMWKGLLLPELIPTCMTLELEDRTKSKPVGIAKYVKAKVGVFHFPADFVVVDFEPDPRVPLILGRCFLKTGRSLIDVHKGELTLRIINEAITYNLDQTSRYSANYDQITANKIDVTDVACEEYSQEVLGFSNVTASSSPTPSDNPIVSTTSPILTPFRDSDFLLFEEADAFLGLEDDPDSPELDPSYYDPEGDILLLEAILNSDPSPPLPNHEQSVPSFKEELKACEAKTIKSSIDEPLEVELKDLPLHLEYAFLEGDNKFPVIIAKELRDEEKSAPIKDYNPPVQHQRRVNPKIHDVIKKEVEKLLDAGLIYPISDSPWVSLIHYVPKKGGFTVVANEENEFIPIHLVTGWRVCIDYRKLNEATRKDHFPLPFMDQMLERLAGNEYYCFLDGFSGYFQIPIDPRDQERLHSHAPTGRSPIVASLSVYAMRRACFKGTLKKKLTEAPILIAPNWDLSFELMCDASDFAIGAENLTADHLSRLENPYENVLDPKEINETFPLETLSMVNFRGDSGAPWFGTVELSQANGPMFKVNSHCIKHYFGGDVPQLVEDLSKPVQNVEANFMDLDSTEDEPIIVVDESEEVADKTKEIHATSHIETKDTSVPTLHLQAKPFCPNVAQLTELLVKSLTPEHSKLLYYPYYISSLPTKLKELPSKFNELTGELKELKKHVHDLEIELPRDLKEILNKLETFTSTAKIKTLDALPSLLNNVTEALNKFTQQPIPTTTPATLTIPPIITTITTHMQSPFLPSPLRSSPHPEGEHINKDKNKKSMSLKDIKQKGGDHVHLTKEQINELKRLRDLPELKQPNMKWKLHQGHGLDDHARTFSSLVLAEVGKRNLNPLKQIRPIE